METSSKSITSDNTNNIRKNAGQVHMKTKRYPRCLSIGVSLKNQPLNWSPAMTLPHKSLCQHVLSLSGSICTFSDITSDEVNFLGGPAMVYVTILFDDGRSDRREGRKKEHQIITKTKAYSRAAVTHLNHNSRCTNYSTHRTDHMPPPSPPTDASCCLQVLKYSHYPQRLRYTQAVMAPASHEH